MSSESEAEGEQEKGIPQSNTPKHVEEIHRGTRQAGKHSRKYSRIFRKLQDILEDSRRA